MAAEAGAGPEFGSRRAGQALELMPMKLVQKPSILRAEAGSDGDEDEDA